MAHDCQLVVSLLLLPFAVLAKEIPELWSTPIDLLLRNEVEHGIRYSKKEEELNGKFKVEDLLEPSNFAELGSGVDGIAMPHTTREEFRGLTINELNKETAFSWTPNLEQALTYATEFGIEIFKKEEDLKGKYRFVADNLLTKEECEELTELVHVAELGSGYNDDSSPHTQRENLGELTLPALTELIKKIKIPVSTAKLFLDRSERGRTLMETYFNLTHLYFDYIHFVCRSVKNEYEGHPGFDNLSHSLHGDNCIFKSNRCVREPPAYIWRDYSAIIYLNDDIDGGEFVFSDVDEVVRAQVKPRCGRMVAFSAEIVHGVKAVTRGTRCAIGLWLTLDAAYGEAHRVEAEDMMKAISAIGSSDNAESAKFTHGGSQFRTENFETVSVDVVKQNVLPNKKAKSGATR